MIDFHGGPRSSWLTWITGAPRRIGYTIPGRSWMYTDRVDRPRELRPRHSVANQSDLLAPLGIAPLDPAEDPAEMVEAPDARRRVDTMLATAGLTPGAELIVIHVSAGNPFRRWPAAAFAALAVALARSSPRRRILLTSGPSESDAAAAIARAAREALGPDAAGRVVLTDEPGLAELRVLVARAALFIGGDSGPLHIACDDAHADRGDLRSDAERAVRAVARPAARDRGGRTGPAALPAVRSARVCARRFPLPAADHTARRVAAAAERALARAATGARQPADAARHRAGAPVTSMTTVSLAAGAPVSAIASSWPA